MATTIGLTVNALEQIDMLEEFDGEMDVIHEEYILTVRYSLDRVEIARVQKMYYNHYRDVSNICNLVNVGLLSETILGHLRNRKMEFNIIEAEREREHDELMKEEYQERITNRAGTMSGD